LRFSQKRQNGYAPIFFAVFGRKHLCITTYIEKHCTQPLKSLDNYPITSAEDSELVIENFEAVLRSYQNITDVAKYGKV